MDEYREGFGSVSDVKIKARKVAARNLAKKLIKDLEIMEAPVNLRYVIEHIQKDMDLYIKSDNLSNNISGILVKIISLEDDQKEPTFVIGFNKNDPWCRRRFSIGHEIGHLFFGTLCNKDEQGKSTEETECNTFSAELLVPKEILKRDFKKLGRIPDLAKKYLVSEESMSIKIIDDRLI